MSWGNISEEIQKGNRMIFGSVARSSAGIAAAAEETINVTVTGAELGDYVLCWSYSVDLGALTSMAYVDAADSVKIELANATGATITPGAGTARVIVMKRSELSGS